MTVVRLLNGEKINLPPDIDFEILKRIVKILSKESKKQQDKMLEIILGNYNPNKRPREDKETYEQTLNETLSRIDALEKQQKEHKIQQQLIERIKKYVANHIYDENGNQVEGDTFFSNPNNYLKVFSERMEEDSIYKVGLINVTPLQTIEYRQYMSPTGFILDLLGFLDRYMENFEKGLEYGRAYEVRRFAVDELIRVKLAEKALSCEEESYIHPQVRLFPMEPMSKEDVKECFSIVHYKQGKAMTPISVINERSADAYAQKNIVKNLYKDYYKEIFPDNY